ncbi:MAG TPA: DUF4129 domain-containing protein [Bacillales bacterium]|nr:DUF4129 domain-containing protein [Bacillales bacterium]
MKVWERLVRYGYEGLALFSVLILFYMFEGEWPPLIPYLSVYLLVPPVIVPLLKRKTTVSYGALLAFIPVFALIAWLAGFPLFIAAGLAAFCCWRAFAHVFQYEDASDGVHAVTLFFMTTLFGLCLYLFFPGYPFRENILFLLILQFLFFLGMNMLSLFREPSSLGRAQKRLYLRWGIGTLTGIIAISVFIVVVFPAVKWLFFSVLALLIKGAAMIAGYPIRWFISMLFGQREAEDFFNRYFDPPEGGAAQSAPPSGGYDSSVSYEWIFFTLLVILFIIVFIVVRRKRAALHRHFGAQPPEGHMSLTGAAPGRKRRKKRAKPPNDPVRRRFYQLQKTLARLGAARRPDESVTDWFSRLDVGPSEKQTIADAYGKVRYGGKRLADDERSRYEQAVKALIKEARRRQGHS